MERILRVGLILWLCLFTADLLALNVSRPGDTAQSELADPTIWLGRLVWAVAAAGLIPAAIVLIRHLLRRLYATEMVFVDASATPLPMRLLESDYAAALCARGFRPMGVLELRPRFDKPQLSWQFASLDGRVTASLSQARRRVTFATHWRDGSVLATLSAPFRAVETPHVRLQGAANLAEAYALHMATAPSVNRRGDVVLVTSMADVLAAEESERLFLPEILAHQRVLEFTLLISAAAVWIGALILFRPF